MFVLRFLPSIFIGNVLSFIRISRNSPRISRSFERYFYSRKKKYRIRNVFEVYGNAVTFQESHETQVGHFLKGNRWIWSHGEQNVAVISIYLRQCVVRHGSHGQEKNSHHESLQHVDFWNHYSTIIPPKDQPRSGYNAFFYSVSSSLWTFFAHEIFRVALHRHFSFIEKSMQL